MPIDPVTEDDKATLLFYLYIRQMGAIADCLRHIQGDKKGASCDDEEVKGWVAHLKTELADVLEITRRMARLFGIGFDTIEVLGTVRDAEKRREYLQRHPGAHWA